MIQKVRVLGIALKDREGDICYFVNSEIFDKRINKKSIYKEPYTNLHNNQIELKKVLKKLESQNTFKDYSIVLAEYVVSIDLSLIYKNEGLAQIDSVQGNFVNISLVGGTKRGYQYFNNSECILSKKVEEYKQDNKSNQLVA